MSTIKGLPQGSILYCLVKGEELKYSEGSLVSVSAPRNDIPQMPSVNFSMPPAIRTVVDVTFNVDGKTYTETIGEADSTVIPKTMGAVALISPDKEVILQEIRATLKGSEDYLKDVNRQENRVQQCKELISQLDTAFAEKQAMDARITKLEESSVKTNELLTQILKEIKK